MDDFSRRYIYLLGAVCLAGMLWWLSSLDFRVSALNDILAADEQLAAYPYEFRVLSLREGVAEMSSPRSPRASAVQSLRIMFPGLANAGALSDEMVAAQRQLAQVQSRAGNLIGEQEDVRKVRWILDERWLSNHGAYID